MNLNEESKLSVLLVISDPKLIFALETTAKTYKVDIIELIHMILYEYFDIE